MTRHHSAPDSTRSALAPEGAYRALRALMPLVARLGDAKAANDVAPVLRPEPVAALLESAIAHDRRCALKYRAEDGAETLREVDPLAVAWRGDGAVLLAYCQLRQELRSFRLERIEAVTALATTRSVRPTLAVERFLQRRRMA